MIVCYLGGGFGLAFIGYGLLILVFGNSVVLILDMSQIRRIGSLMMILHALGLLLLMVMMAIWVCLLLVVVVMGFGFKWKKEIVAWLLIYAVGGFLVC